MAWKMKLNTPYKGMPHLWNISAHVSLERGKLNSPDDIELIQRLFVEYRKVQPPVTRVDSIGVLTAVTRKLDAITAMEMMWIADSTKPFNYALEMSPARNGSVRYGSGIFTIAELNERLYSRDPSAWAKIPELCSPAVKQQLLTKTAP